MIAELGSLAWLSLVVAFGAIVPVIPTGAAVSGAAALAFHTHSLTILLVLLAGAAGAYAGDLVMYAMCRFGGEKLARRLRWLRDEEHLASVKQRLLEKQVPVRFGARPMLGHDRPHQSGAIAEVVLQRRRVALARLAVDLPQRHPVDAPIREQLLGGADERRRCTRAARAGRPRHRGDHTDGRRPMADRASQ